MVAIADACYANDFGCSIEQLGLRELILENRNWESGEKAHNLLQCAVQSGGCIWLWRQQCAPGPAGDGAEQQLSVRRTGWTGLVRPCAVEQAAFDGIDVAWHSWGLQRAFVESFLAAGGAQAPCQTQVLVTAMQDAPQPASEAADHPGATRPAAALLVTACCVCRRHMSGAGLLPAGGGISSALLSGRTPAVDPTQQCCPMCR